MPTTSLNGDVASSLGHIKFWNLGASSILAALVLQHDFGSFLVLTLTLLPSL